MEGFQSEGLTMPKLVRPKTTVGGGRVRDTLSPLLRKVTGDLETTLRYWLYWTSESSFPLPVVKALCDLAWPGREFVPDSGYDDDAGDDDSPFCTLEGLMCAETGENAHDLWDRDYADLPIYPAWKPFSRDGD